MLKFLSQHLKLQKKEQKRAKIEQKEKSNEEKHKICTEILEVQSLLENFDDEVKEDFLNGTNGACVSVFMFIGHHSFTIFLTKDTLNAFFEKHVFLK